MKEQLEQIKAKALADLAAAADMSALDAVRVRVLGKKGELTAVLKQMGKLSAEERPVMGQLANSVRASIEEELEKRGVLSHTISMDNYFKTLDPKTAPRTADGLVDFESPKCMDMDLLNSHFAKLSKGETIVVPKFEFARQMRNDHLGTPLRLKKNEIAIFEGIHALNDACAGRNPAATCLYISARSDVLEGEDLRFKGTWMRLTRRAVRDYNFRGTGVGETMDMWANVRRGEKLYISPYKYRANLILDTALPYEICVFGQYAPILRQALPKENVRHREMGRMIDAFSQFVPIDPSLVAPDSLIREFIGNSGA